MSATVLRADARHLPLPDASVDLIVTSPPYFGLRSYTDGGEHYAGQIGSEATPQEWLEALWACTAEWVRVLKPEGSLFVNLGDKYGASLGSNHGTGRTTLRDFGPKTGKAPVPDVKPYGTPKSLLGLPWRYAIGCMDRLGLILRAEIVWAKPNGLPESVTDRVRRAHEQVFHFTRQPRYYAAVDEIREPHQPQSIARTKRQYNAGDLFSVGTPNTLDPAQFCNPLGKLPGSVWDIPSQPLSVPASLGVDHFAAFPMELPRRIIQGWSPPGVCTACHQGRRPVHDGSEKILHRPAGINHIGKAAHSRRDAPGRERIPARERPGSTDVRTVHRIIGYTCACAEGGMMMEPARTLSPACRARMCDACTGYSGDHDTYTCSCRCHEARFSPPPTRPAVVLDPFSGTGTTILVASVLGRHGIGVDLSADYCRLATWRTRDRGEIARAMQVPKPPPVPDGQEALWA